ncbi:MAG: heparinase II/III family protein, partial [Bacteroidetes bacterium]|nr:heparinase II/III family protein [Bacteroidota bacterium]
QDALPLSAVMPDAGYAVFRGGWEPDAMYVALIGKHGLARTHRSPVGSGHKQANETAFILHAGGELLATEPGYHSSDERTPLIFADHHNVILVDGKGADSTSFGSFLFGVDAFMEHGVVAGNSGMVSIRTRYQEADITRLAAVLNGRYLVLADEASSVRTRTFTHQIHGNGSTSRGTFSAAYNEHTGMWTAGEMRLHAVVHDASGTVSHVTQERKHAPSSRRFDTHEAMYSSVRGQRAVFHTVLHAAHQAQDVQAYTVNPLEGVTLTHIRSAKDQLLSVVNGTDGSITLHTPVLGAVETDAFGLFSILETAGRPDSWMLDGGSFIRLDGRMLLSSSQSLHAALLMETDTWRLVTTSGKPADILLRVPFHVYDINGSGVRNWDLQGNTLTLSVDESSDVSITFSSMPTSTEDIQLQPERLEIHALYPQPLKAGTVGTLTVAYELPDATTVRVVLSDMLGRPLRILPVALLPAGIHHARFSVADIPPGVYNIHIESGHSGAHRRIVIQ